MASVDSSDIPAGFFSTFSIADPYNPAPGHVVKAQKRNRRVFVCIPCHRRKLKCDKLLPCSRCVAAEITDECSYMPPPSPAAGRSKKSRDRKAVDRGRVAKDTVQSKKTKVKRESSPALSVSSFSSHSSSLSPCPSSFPSRSPSPDCSANTSSAHSQAKKPKRNTTVSINVPSFQITSHLDSEDEGCDGVNFDKIGSNGSTSTKPLNGSSHWTRIACEFREAVPFLFGTDLRWQQRCRQVKSLKCLFPSLDDNINFPFSNINPASKGQILGSLPPNHIVDILVSNYLDSFGATHCLFHPAQLRYEIRQFYDAPSDVSDEWLAQLCMIIALGSESSSDFSSSGSGQSAAEWAAIFLNAAQASFGRSSYMVAPTLCTVRTLCMMVLAKLIEVPASGGSCSGSSGCNSAAGGGSDSKAVHTNGYTPLVSLMAFTMNMATSLQLHRSPKAAKSVPHNSGNSGADKQNSSDSVESEMRRRTWVTVRLLDLNTALRAGTMTMQRPGDYDTEPPQPLPITNLTCGGSDCGTVYDTPNSVHYNTSENTGYCYLGGMPLNDYGFKATHTAATSTETDNDFHGDPNGLYQYKLASVLPLLVDMVNAANSPTKPSPRYAQVTAWGLRTRKFLDEIKTFLLPSRLASHRGMETDSEGGWQQQGYVQQLGVDMFDTVTSPDRMHRATVQYQYLETLAHRTLLALHHDSFCQSTSPSGGEASNPESAETSALHAMSQAAIVESSLALLNTHRTWAAAVTDLTDRCPSTCTNMTTSATATATAASVDSPFSSMLQLPSGGGPVLGLIKSTAAEMIIQQQQHQLQQLPISLSGRSSPTTFGCGSDVTTIATGPPMSTTAATASPMMHNTGWLFDLCHDDFGAALLYMVLVLRSVHCQGHNLLLGRPQDEAAAVTAVRHSYQIMRDSSYRSVAHFKEFLGVAILFACFRGLRSGGDMLSQVVDATNDVEQVVVAGRRYLLWAADSLTAPDEATLMGFNGPLMAYGGL